ncbi:MAG: hypothetical protein P1V51_23695 [Deltaproteobacteria bacterium]|nr:hypothetical protein [Deltaproteobacteria bacterium]
MLILGGLLLSALSGCTCGGGLPNGACTPATCEELGRNCGPVDDGCGHEVHCGYCGGGLTCGGNGVEGVCGGLLSCSRSSCAEASAVCGEIPDGCGGTLTCGFCSGGLVCSGEDSRDCGVPTCERRSCAQAGAECGEIPDGCGGRVGCGGAGGSCSSGICGGGGPNRCGSDPCDPITSCPAGRCGVISNGCDGIVNCGDPPTGQLCTVDGHAIDPNGEVGSQCQNDRDCTTGYCQTSTVSGWPSGYCTTWCTTTSQCGTGSHCAFRSGGRGICVENCSGTTCARTGYICTDADGDSQQECVPGGTGTGQVGDACTSVANCAGGAGAICIADPAGGPGGYCTTGCGSGKPACPAGTHCGFDAGASVCVVDCATSANCRAGYLCSDWDGDGSNECSPGGNIGDPCTADTECAFGNCLTGTHPGGYCSLGCTTSNDCPPGSVCGSGQCIQSCNSNLDCRSGGYACVEQGSTTGCVPYGSGTGGPGAPCSSVADCAGGVGVICQGADTGAGTCAQGCNADTDCGPGQRCVNGADGQSTCEITCASDADCQPNYTCKDVGEGLICMPGISGGSGQVGDGCTDDDQCEDNICILQKDNAWRGGYCSAPCADGYPCPSGSHCSAMGTYEGVSGGICFESCSSHSDCTRQGFRCWDHDGDGVNECAGYAGGGGVTGDTCTAIDECGGGNTGTCFLPAAFPAGYCTQNCSSGGCSGAGACTVMDDARYCMDTLCCDNLRLCDLDNEIEDLYAECPSGTTCKTVLTAPAVGANVGYCAYSSTCSGTVACPDGTYCSADVNGECLHCESGSAAKCRADYDCFDRVQSGTRACWPAAKGSGAPGAPCTRIRDCNGGVHGTCAEEDPDGNFLGGYCLWDCTDGTACPSGSACIDFRYDTPQGTEHFAWCLDTCSSNSSCRASYTCQELNPGRSKVCFPDPG